MRVLHVVQCARRDRARRAGTAVIVTAAFVHEAEVQRQALGADTLDPVVITHPLSTLSDEAMQARALEAVGQIQRILTGT